LLSKDGIKLLIFTMYCLLSWNSHPHRAIQGVIRILHNECKQYRGYIVQNLSLELILIKKPPIMGLSRRRFDHSRKIIQLVLA